MKLCGNAPFLLFFDADVAAAEQNTITSKEEILDNFKVFDDPNLSRNHEHWYVCVCTLLCRRANMRMARWTQRACSS